MNNTELDAVLKKARRPEPPEEFWEEFPQQVARRLNRARTEIPRSNRNWFPRLAWGLATAICVLAAFMIGNWRGRVETKTAASKDILQNVKFVQGTLAMFPNQVRAIVRDRNGLNLILSHNGDVPSSPPIYVRVCDGEHCTSYVTFSGQEIQVAGQKLTVLSDGRDGIILEGKKFAWSSNGKNYAQKNLEIEARHLGTAS